jgi:hypothetical protein
VPKHDRQNKQYVIPNDGQRVHAVALMPPVSRLRRDMRIRHNRAGELGQPVLEPLQRPRRVAGRLVGGGDAVEVKQENACAWLALAVEEGDQGTGHRQDPDPVEVGPKLVLIVAALMAANFTDVSAQLLFTTVKVRNSASA